MATPEQWLNQGVIIRYRDTQSSSVDLEGLLKEVNDRGIAMVTAQGELTFYPWFSIANLYQTETGGTQHPGTNQQASN
jgi:hypothetical protein